MNDFSKFDKQVNIEELVHNVEEAAKNGSGDYPEVPKGNYTVSLEKLELGETKDNRPMLKAQFKIKKGEFKNQMLFYNRVLYGTKNDANMIASAVGFLKKLGPSEDVGIIEFKSYSQFADLALDIMEDLEGKVEYDVAYNPDAFNSISIIDTFDV